MCQKRALMPVTGMAPSPYAAMLFAATLAWPVEALARPEAPPAPRDPNPAPQKAAPRDTPRPLPDYDGRRGIPSDGENAGTWTLRVLFFPAYVVSEYLIRRPIGWAVVEAERANLADWLIDFFTFGPNREATLYPTALLDFGFQPSVGLALSWRDAFVKRNTLSVQAATGGFDWLRLSIRDRYEFQEGRFISVRLEGWRRPDWLFYGLGPSSEKDDEGRYKRVDFDGTLELDAELPRTSWLNVYAGFRSRSFSSEGEKGDPISELVEEGAYDYPPGFQGYQLYRQGMTLSLDTRRARPAAGSGVRVAGRVEQGFRINGSAPDQFLRYGGTIGGFLDLTGQNRTVGLSVGAFFADPLGDSDTPIPFTEQVVLGGSAPMRGFLQGRLVDRSALVARLEYTWPIWVLLDGSFTAEMGNVYGPHLSNFELELARLSFALGIRAHGRRDRPFEMLLGLGTTPLEDGAEIDTVRVLFGVTDAF